MPAKLFLSLWCVQLLALPHFLVGYMYLPVPHLAPRDVANVRAELELLFVEVHSMLTISCECFQNLSKMVLIVVAHHHHFLGIPLRPFTLQVTNPALHLVVQCD